MQTRDQCAAIQYSDEMHCPRCRLRWDTNDPEPPPCAPKSQSGVPIVSRVKPMDVRKFVSGLPDR